MVRLALMAGDDAAMKAARGCVNQAKQGLAGRGPVWSTDGTTDLTCPTVRSTLYAEWFGRGALDEGP